MPGGAFLVQVSSQRSEDPVATGLPDLTRGEVVTTVQNPLFRVPTTVAEYGCRLALVNSRFDLGRSFYQHKDVWELVKEKLPVSISLGLWTFFISYLISVPLGVAKAVRAGSRFDLVTTLLILVGYAIPGFLFANLLIVLFAGGSFVLMPVAPRPDAAMPSLPKFSIAT